MKNTENLLIIFTLLFEKNVWYETYPPDSVVVALNSYHYSLGDIRCGDFSELSVTVEGAEGIQGMDPLVV